MTIIKQPELLEKITVITQYIYFTPLVLGNIIIYLVILNIVLLFLFILIVLLLIITIKDKPNIKYYNYYISILSRTLPFVCLTFFGQVFGFLISIFICSSDNKSIIHESLECRNGILFHIEATLCSICLCFFTFFSFITIILFFRPDFILEENDVFKKTSSIPDVILFINKIIFIILFDAIRCNESHIWFILFLLFIITFINAFTFFHYSNYENKILMALHKILSLTLFWNVCCLIIGKIFQNSSFNGTFHIFFFGIILIIIIFIYYKEKINEFYIIDIKRIDSSQGQLNYIKRFFNLIKTKDKYRKDFITFNTLILLKEEECIDNNCKIKKYLQMAGKGFESDFILFQYCQQLFEQAIKKFPNDIILKCNYIVFLTVQMNNKKLALKVLSTLIINTFNFQNNYIISCCKKYIKICGTGTKKNFEEQNKNIMKTTEYEKIFEIFKDKLSKASFLYYEFWSSLYRSHLQGSEDFIKLNNIGERLNSLKDIIEQKFNKLYNVKSDDVRVLNLYSGFLKNILNNKIRYNELKNMLLSLSNVDKIQEKEIDFSKFDLKLFNNSDEYKYIIISAEEQNLGIILNISLNACQLFGYNRNELIGKKITILFPKIYHKLFKRYSKQYSNKIKTKFYDLLSQKKEYYPEYIDIFIEGKNKAKYLVLLYFKIFFAQTEENEHVFILNFIYEDDIIINKINETFNINSSNYLYSKELKYYNFCCVLTDLNFNIQLFTANCQELLGLTTDVINANIDITKFIKQFKEEVDKMVYEQNKNNNNENENELPRNKKSNLNILKFAKTFKNKNNLTNTYKSNYGENPNSSYKKILYKRYIAENKYSQVHSITWKIHDLMQLLVGEINNDSNLSISNRSNNTKHNKSKYEIIFNKRNVFYGNTKERPFLLVVKKALLFGDQVGYKFTFKRQKLKNKDYEDVDELKIKNIEFPQKSKVTFKSFDINNKDDEKNNEEIIHSCHTGKTKISNYIKNINKAGENIDNLEESQSLIHFQTDDSKNNIDLERSESLKLKKNILKKKPIKYISLNENKLNSFNKDLNAIDRNFIPICYFSFSLDLNNMSFIPCFKENKIDKTINFLKNEAMNKIKQYQIMKNNIKKNELSFSSDDSSYEEIESNEEDNFSSSNSNTSISNNNNDNNNDNVKKKQTINPNNREKEKEIKSIKEEIEGNYYKIEGLKKIRFMIYDFDQEMIIDKGNNIENKSEVENIIINYKLNISTEIDKDINDPSFTIRKLLSKYTNKEIRKEKTKLKNTNIILINQDKNLKEEETNKRIENSLMKNNTEKLIKEFNIFILLSFIILTVISGFILYFILSSLSKVKNNLYLIIYSTNLRHYTNMGIYFIREIIILTLDNSDNIYKNMPYYEYRTVYLQNLTDNLKEVFTLGHSNIEAMMGTNFDLSEQNSYNLNIKTFKTVVRSEGNKIRNITSTLSVSITQIYLYFYNIIISGNISYNNDEVFNFIYNSINNVGIGIEEVIKIYLSEVKIKKMQYIIYSLIILIISFIFYAGIFILIKNTYIHIIHKKERYISIFYCINIYFIKTSMLKCEKFINKINPHELLITQEKNNDISNNSMSYSNIDDDNISNNIINKKYNDKYKELNNTNGKKIKYKEKSKNRKFKMRLFIILLISFFYAAFILWNFIYLVNEVEIMSFYIYHMQHIHNNLLNLYNSYREFLFYKDTKMFNDPIIEYSENIEKEIYETITEDINYIQYNSNKIVGLNKIFLEIQKKNLCMPDYSEDEFFNVNICDNYMKVITSLGFYSFIFFWFEEIRTKKHLFLLIEEKKDISINNIEDRVIEYFNMEGFFPDVNYMFNYAILPFINEERNLTMAKIINNIRSKEYIYITLFFLYFLFILILYIFFWRPIINNVKTIINKTKNMLTLIPVDILASQTNIKELLGISDLND